MHTMALAGIDGGGQGQATTVRHILPSSNFIRTRQLHQLESQTQLASLCTDPPHVHIVALPPSPSFWAIWVLSKQLDSPSLCSSFQLYERSSHAVRCAPPNCLVWSLHFISVLGLTESFFFFLLAMYHDMIIVISLRFFAILQAYASRVVTSAQTHASCSAPLLPAR